MNFCKNCNINLVRSIKSHYCEDCFVEVRKETRKKSHIKNKEMRNLISIEYKKNNREKIKDYNKQYQTINKDNLSQKRKEKRKENCDKLNESSREWRRNNKDKVSEYNRKHTPLYREKYPWIYACRNLIYNTIKRIGTEKEDKTINLLKYSSLDLKEYLENQFLPEMSWDNYGEWHIDHIRPISDFPKDTPPDIINELSNLQPLWREDNLRKGKKYDKTAF